MKFKQWPSWLRMGIIFLSIFLIINLISILLKSILVVVATNLIGLFIVIQLGYDFMNSGTMLDPYFFIMIFISSALWFALGALIGFMKSKYKKQFSRQKFLTLYYRSVSLRDFFLQKKHITRIQRFRLAGSIQIFALQKLL